MDDFRPTAPTLAGNVRVMPLDEAVDEEATIVVIPLRYAPASIFLELDAEARWNATLTERTDALTGSSLDLVALGTEVAAAGELCAHLQRRTDAHA